MKICKLSKHCVTFTFTYSSTKTATLVREGTLRHNVLVPLSGAWTDLAIYTGPINSHETVIASFIDIRVSLSTALSLGFRVRRFSIKTVLKQKAIKGCKLSTGEAQGHGDSFETSPQQIFE